MHHGLPGASFLGIGFGGVHPVFQNIQIKGTHINNAEVMKRMEKHMKVKILIGVTNSCYKLLQAM